MSTALAAAAVMAPRHYAASVRLWVVTKPAISEPAWMLPVRPAGGAAPFECFPPRHPPVAAARRDGQSCAAPPWRRPQGGSLDGSEHGGTLGVFQPTRN